MSERPFLRSIEGGNRGGDDKRAGREHLSAVSNNEESPTVEDRERAEKLTQLLFDSWDALKQYDGEQRPGMKEGMSFMDHYSEAYDHVHEHYLGNLQKEVQMFDEMSSKEDVGLAEISNYMKNCVAELGASMQENHLQEVEDTDDDGENETAAEIQQRLEESGKGEVPDVHPFTQKLVPFIITVEALRVAVARAHEKSAVPGLYEGGEGVRALRARHSAFAQELDLYEKKEGQHPDEGDVRAFTQMFERLSNAELVYHLDRWMKANQKDVGFGKALNTVIQERIADKESS